MRSLLFGFVLVVTSACTRANPDAVHLGGGDLSLPPLGGSGQDLAASRDLAGGGAVDLPAPPDLGSHLGVTCGSSACAAPSPVCCLDNGSTRCTSSTGCNNGGVAITCDGPEDCTTLAANVCCGSGGGGGTPGTQCRFSCGGGEVPVCHELSDCPPLSGYMRCCAVPGTTLSRCSTSTTCR